MALVVEDGTGVSGADAYVNEIGVTTYLDAHGGSSSWTDLSPSEKESTVRLATQYLELRYKNLWKGVRRTSGQGLSWPRINVLDQDGYVVASNIVPTVVIQATAEACRRLADGVDLLPDQSRHTIKRELVKVAVITKDVEYLHGKKVGSSFTTLDALLIGLLRANTSYLGTTERG